MDDHWEFYDTNTRGSGIGTESDSFVFASKSYCGDGQLIAQVASIDDMTADGFAGIMMRETVVDDSAMIMLGFNSAGDLLLSTRTATGEDATTNTAATGLSLPVFFQITRTANQFTPAYSTDGISWTSLAPLALDLPIVLRAGLASASGTTGSQADVVFREWESLDVAAYPLRPRPLDGLSQFFAYALGVGEGENASRALPKLTLTGAEGAIAPEMQFHRRIGMSESQFFINWLGENLDLRQDDSSNWSLLEVAPNPDGISETVRMRRAEDPSPGRGFFSLEVGK